MSAGETARTGDTINNYCLVNGSMMPSQWEIPAGTVAEIEGVEIHLEPDTSDDPTVYNPLEYIRLEINEQEIENISFNELMAPMSPGGGLFTGKQVFREANVCTNIGKAILAGGQPFSPTAKMGPGDKLRIAVKSPRAIRGGTTISTLLIVRVHVCTGTFGDIQKKWPSGFIDQSVAGYTKQVPADLDHWNELHGGLAVKTPYIERYITYGKNITATDPHQQYMFSRRMRTVDDGWQSLEWELKDDEIVQITHIGVAEDESNGYHANPNVSYISIPHYPEQIIVFPVTPYPHTSAFPMPLNRALDPIYSGPGELPIPATLHNENASITIRDNGTAVVGWTQTNVGVTVAIWGYRYRLW